MCKLDPAEQVNLLELDEREVEDFFKGLGEPKYRAKQVDAHTAHCYMCHTIFGLMVAKDAK